MKIQIYIALVAFFGGMMFSSIFITHSSTWGFAIAPFSIGLFGLIFDKR
jgi:hypothetical protein